MALYPHPEPPLSHPGPFRTPPAPQGWPLGGGCPPMSGGHPAPLQAPSGPPLGPFWSPRSGTEIRTDSGDSFGNSPRRHRTGRCALEQVKYRVNSMSPISRLGRSGDTPGALLESQLALRETISAPRSSSKYGAETRGRCWGEKGPGTFPQDRQRQRQRRRQRQRHRQRQ